MSTKQEKQRLKEVGLFKMPEKKLLTMRLFTDGIERRSVCGIVCDTTLDLEIAWTGDSQGNSTVGLAYREVKTVAEAFKNIIETAKSEYPNARIGINLDYEKIE